MLAFYFPLFILLPFGLWERKQKQRIHSAHDPPVYFFAHCLWLSRFPHFIYLFLRFTTLSPPPPPPGRNERKRSRLCVVMTLPPLNELTRLFAMAQQQRAVFAPSSAAAFSIRNASSVPAFGYHLFVVWRHAQDK